MMTVEEGRKAIRYTTTTFDGEIQSSMEACLLDLQTAGVVIPVDEDSLVDTAVTLWLRWHFNYCNRGPEYEKNYKALKDSMAMTYDGSQEEAAQWTTRSC